MWIQIDRYFGRMKNYGCRRVARVSWKHLPITQSIHICTTGRVAFSANGKVDRLVLKQANCPARSFQTPTERRNQGINRTRAIWGSLLRVARVELATTFELAQFTACRRAIARP